MPSVHERNAQIRDVAKQYTGDIGRDARTAHVQLATPDGLAHDLRFHATFLAVGSHMESEKKKKCLLTHHWSSSTLWSERIDMPAGQKLASHLACHTGGIKA